MASTSDETTYEVPATLSNDTDIVIFSTSGKKRPRSDFEAVYKSYDKQIQDGVKTPSVPSGFTVQMLGSGAAKLRSGLAAVASGIEAPFNRAVERYSGEPAAYPQLPPISQQDIPDRFLRGMFQTPRTALNAAMPVIEAVGNATKAAALRQAQTMQGIAQGVTSQLTPGNIGALGASAATAYVPPLRSMRNMTGLLPYLVRGGAAGAGYYGAESATGGFTGQSTPSKLYDTAVASAGAMASLGADRLFKHAMNVSVGQRMGRMNEQAAEASKHAYEVAEQEAIAAMAKRYPNLVNAGPQGFKAYAATKGGIQDLTQIGMKAIKTDADSAAMQLVQDLRSTLPRPTQDILAKRYDDAFSTMEKAASRYGKATIQMLDNLGDSKQEVRLRSDAQKVMDDTIKIIDTQIKRALFGDEKPKGELLLQQLAESKLPRELKISVLTRLAQQFTAYQEREQGYLAGAQILHYFKKTGQDTGFNPVAFQREALKIQSKHGPLFREVTQAFQRGIEGQVPQIAPQTRSLPLSGYLPQAIKQGGYQVPLYTEYPSTIPQTDVSLPLQPLISETIREYLKSRE